jgi:tellurite resistance protein
MPALMTTARLQHLPLPLFAAPMGIGGLGMAWREGARGLGAPAFIGEALLLLATLLWLALVGLHLARARRHPAALAGDLRHPVRAAFLGTVSIGVMIIAGGLTPYAPGLAADVWLVGVAAHFGIGTWTVRGLLRSPKEAAVLTPPLLIPLVGNILAPVFGAPLGFPALNWMLFGLGALLWAMLQPLLLYRLILGPPLPAALRPALVIFLAPPAVGALSLAGLTGGFGPGPLGCLGLALLVAAVMLTLVGDFARAPFAMSWWGWTFPSAAFASALQVAARSHPAAWQKPLLWLVLLAASCIVAVVASATLRRLLDGRLLVPEG